MKLRKRLKGSQAPTMRLTLFAPHCALRDQFKLEADPATPDKKPEVPKYKWLHVATGGSFDGHADGEFTLDKKVFDGFVANFHSDPRYTAPTAGWTEGTDGGMTQVIPFDFEHASELAANEGSIPVTGAPAPAWALEAQVRGTAEAPELWVYAKLGDRIREYIANDEYRHVSIAFSLDASDPVTDTSIGPRLSSIAFTNHPFLRGLTSIAASDRTGAMSTRLLYWYDAAGSPEQGIEYTRQCLGLGATADVNEVKSEVAKIAGFALAPETTPPGVDIDDIFQGLRKIWTLPVSSTVVEIVAEIDKAAAQMAAKLAAAQAVPPAPAIPPAPAAAPTPPAPVAATEPKVKPMLKRILKALQKLGLSKHATLLTFGRAIKLDASEVTEDEVVAYVEQLVALADATTGDLNTWLEASGFPNAAAAIAGMPDLLAAKSKLADLARQLDEAMSMQAQVDQSMQEADVAAAASSKGLAGDDGKVDPVITNALTAHRASLIAAEVAKLTDATRSPKTLRAAQQAGRSAFLTECGVVDATRERLLKNLVAGPNGVQLRAPGSRTPAPKGRQLVGRAPASGDDDEGSRRLSNTGGDDEPEVIDISLCEGANPFQRLMSHVRDNFPDVAKKGHEALFAKARALRTLADRGQVVISDINADEEEDDAAAE